MLELICHHTYKWEGLPVDLSPYGNHGDAQQTGFIADAAAAGSGAVQIGFQTSRVKIPPGPAFASLGALRIEAVLRLDGPGFYRTVVWGDESFELRIWANGGLEAGVAAPGGGRQVPLLDSSALYAPDGIDHLVPADRWVTLGFFHDGIASARLWIDGELVGERHGLAAGVPPVGARGVDIGNASVGSAPLRGAIDEIRIWRTDPRAMHREFLSRPVDPATARCLEELLVGLRAALAQDPDGTRRLLAELDELTRRAVRVVAALDPTARAALDAFWAEYLGLWTSGRIDGSEMAGLLGRIWAWLQGTGVAQGPEAGLVFDFVRRSGVAELAVEPASLACDPDLLGFVRLMLEAAGRPPAKGD